MEAPDGRVRFQADVREHGPLALEKELGPALRRELAHDRMGQFALTRDSIHR